MNKSTIRKLIFIAAMYIGFVVFLFSTNPQNIAVGWLILPFIWMFILLFISSLFVINSLSSDNIGSKKQFTTAIVVALVPSLILILDSVSQLTERDILLILVFGCIATFYAIRLRSYK